VDRKEFEAFIEENQTLLERSEKMIQTIEALEKANHELRQKLQAAQESRKTLKANLDRENPQADDTLRQARERTSNVLKLLDDVGKRRRNM
jgi:cell division septum initiation protein DivIVA